MKARERDARLVLLPVDAVIKEPFRQPSVESEAAEALADKPGFQAARA